MKNLKSISIACALFLFSQNLFAQTSSMGSSLQAYKLAKEKKWKEANIEAKNATRSQPNDAEAWFVLGLTEERLENLDEAVTAYEKYLQMLPPLTVAQAVQAQLPDLKKRAEKKNQDRYGRSSNGFFIEKAMSYKPSFVGELNGEINTPLSFGFHFGKVFVGYRRATGSYTGDIKVPNEATTPVTYTTLSGGGQISHHEIFANIHFSLIDPYTTWGNMQLALPMVAGGFVNSIETESTKKTYGNFGYDFGLGLALRGFTRSSFNWYVQGIYHLGIPFFGMRESNSDNFIRNTSDEELHGSVNGFETSIGISFLLGEETSGHY